MMKSESPAKIFNSAQRAYEETATHKRFWAFNSLGEAFGQLKFLTDESLAPQQSITFTPEEEMQIFLIPIAGGLIYRKSTFNEEIVKTEQVKIVGIEKGVSYTLTNPFETEWISYLHIGFKVNEAQQKSLSTLQNIKLETMDELVHFGLNEQLPEQPDGYIGLYRGRSEGGYPLRNMNNGVFIYVIRGAFEAQGRLLEYRDGLALWDTKEIEFEALSNNAIILLMEIKLSSIF